MKKTALLIAVLLSILALPAHAQIRVRHHFDDRWFEDGVWPCGDLVGSWPMLYGMT